MKKKFIASSILLLGLSLLLQAQTPAMSSAQILHELKKLQNPTRVLYLAAHPDDENTRMISHLSNDLGMNTAYLSLTRGDGGQNLIGKELSAELGILRTQELMQARAIDGGQQFFTRAVDFGYSKTSKETLEKWGEEEVLSDVVWVIRKFRPDVIITRFPPDRRAGHGHHTASAELGIKALQMAADKEFYKEQLQYVSPWQPRRIYWNASIWWDRKIGEEAAKNPDYVVMDVGGYSPVLGVSSNELASLSRTQHKSQGFGVSVARGSQKEYLKYLGGERASGDLFDGIDQSWGRYGFDGAGKKLQTIIEDFRPANPSASVSALIKLKRESKVISDELERKRFQSKMDELILACLGFHAEVLSSEKFVIAGPEQEVRLELLNRSPLKLSVTELKVNGTTQSLSEELPSNEILRKEVVIQTAGLDWSQPYWIKDNYTALYPVADQQLIGMPENRPSLLASFSLVVTTDDDLTEPLQIRVPITHKYSDRVDGEIIKPTFIVPAVAVNPSEKQLLFLDGSSHTLDLEVSFQEDKAVVLSFEADGYKVEPSSVELKLKSEKEMTAKLSVTISPESKSTTDAILTIKSDGQKANALYRINYPHIDERIIIKPASVGLKRIKLTKTGQVVGYIPGAGDEVASAIEQMGYEVVILDEKAIRTQDLSRFDAIVAGIRAYNTCDWLPGLKEQLMAYVENGGNYIVQYNTSSRDLLSRDIGPFPFEISRKRVTEEDAQPTFKDPDDVLLSSPNKIGMDDFEGWVQERGLYFANDWDKQYRTPIGWHDDGEDMLWGGLLVADHGKGAFIYTGISFFRELPAGVSGAYRLLANLLSYQPESSKNEQ